VAARRLTILGTSVIRLSTTGDSFHPSWRVELDGQELFYTHVHLHGGPAPVRRYLPKLKPLHLSSASDRPPALHRATGCALLKPDGACFSPADKLVPTYFDVL
jgi:hypothetical protein